MNFYKRKPGNIKQAKPVRCVVSDFFFPLLSYLSAEKYSRLRLET